MSEKKPKFKIKIPGRSNKITLRPAPQPDYVALTKERVTSCRGCGESCPWGSLPGGPECTVQNDIDRRRSSRQN